MSEVIRSPKVSPGLPEQASWRLGSAKAVPTTDRPPGCQSPPPPAALCGASLRLLGPLPGGFLASCQVSPEPGVPLPFPLMMGGLSHLPPSSMGSRGVWELLAVSKICTSRPAPPRASGGACGRSAYTVSRALRPPLPSVLGLRLACLVPLFTLNVVTGFGWVLTGVPLSSLRGPLFFSLPGGRRPPTSPTPGFLLIFPSPSFLLPLKGLLVLPWGSGNC